MVVGSLVFTIEKGRRTEIHDILRGDKDKPRWRVCRDMNKIETTRRVSPGPSGPMKLHERGSCRMADVLVVEDDADTLKLVTLILSRAGYQVLPVERGAEALVQIAKKRPDAILLDIMLPDMDGFTVAQRLKTTMPDPPPILFFSARGSPEDQVTSRILGDGFLMKPVRLSTLLQAMRKVLEANEKKVEPPKN
jgi:two-component system OmpR family response regulator